jgi:hypothetical protein
VHEQEQQAVATAFYHLTLELEDLRADKAFPMDPTVKLGVLASDGVAVASTAEKSDKGGQANRVDRESFVT